MFKSRFVLGAVSVPLAIGCSAGPAASDLPASDDVAVAIETDGLEANDFGFSYGGWTQSPGGEFNWVIGNTYQIASFYQLFQRSSGPSTRGGGACVVVQKAGSSCTNDNAGDVSCTSAAKAQFGSAAWGYCYYSKCYHRPGPQSTFCTLGPNRAPGQYNGSSSYVDIPAGYDTNYIYALGCMTKAAGPSGDCGGSNPSLYMRTVEAMWEP